MIHCAYKTGPNVVKNFAKSLAHFFPNYHWEVLKLVAKLFTTFKVRLWNMALSKYKKMTVRGQTKQAEYINATQGEGRVTRSMAASYFPDDEFPDQITDEELLAFLEYEEPEPEPAVLQENPAPVAMQEGPEPVAGPSQVNEQPVHDSPAQGKCKPKPRRYQPSRKAKLIIRLAPC